MIIDGVEYVKKATEEQADWQIGKCYAIRTVTMLDHGRLVKITDHELFLKDAAWIADTGRFSDFINGKITPNEIEPFPHGSVVIVGRGAIIDACELEAYFKDQK